MVVYGSMEYGPWGFQPILAKFNGSKPTVCANGSWRLFPVTGEHSNRTKTVHRESVQLSDLYAKFIHKLKTGKRGRDLFSILITRYNLLQIDWHFYNKYYQLILLVYIASLFILQVWKSCFRFRKRIIREFYFDVEIRWNY